MIHGVVNFRYELTLSLLAGNSNGKREFVNTVIDTGFDGFLSLPIAESETEPLIGLAIQYFADIDYRLIILREASLKLKRCDCT